MYREVDKMEGSGWIALMAFADPPKPEEGQVVEVRRNAFMGIVTHYRVVRDGNA